MTYTPVWNKYLPVIRILMKKSLVKEQALDMNSIDFLKYGASRKAGYKFKLLISKGRVENVVNTVSMGKELASVLLEDPVVKELAMRNDFDISMNAKFQLSIKSTPNDQNSEASNTAEIDSEEGNEEGSEKEPARSTNRV